MSLPAPALGRRGFIAALPVLALGRETIGFGGLSGLHVDEALRLTSVSDRGLWLTGRIVMEGGAPRALAETRSGPLRDGAGTPLRRGRESDAECLTRLPNGTWLVGFERWHRIRAYATLDGPGTYVEAPPGLEAAPANGGLESLAALRDGRLLAIAEFLPGPAPGTVAAWLGGPGRWLRLAYRPAEGYAPTDACALPDGGALVLERAFSLFSGFSARLTRLAPPALATATAATILEGREILSTRDALPPENWEGVSASLIAGRLTAFLVSDDNERSAQRTLLAAFPLPD